jgi:hypothetical protein
VTATSRPLCYLAVLLLAACTCPPPRTIAVKTWTPEEQRQILAEEQKLPGDSILIAVLMDYARLRHEAK